MAEFRTELLAILDTDRSMLCAAAEDDVALAKLVERIAYRLQVEAGVPVEPRGARAGAAAGAMPLTRDMLTDLEPHFAEKVAASLAGLLDREPWKTRPGWDAERIILGAFTADLRVFATEAGEPIGAARDLRNAQTKADERIAIQRMELEAFELDREISAAIEADHAARQATATTPAPDAAALAWI